MYTMTEEQIVWASDAQLASMLKDAVKERERVIRAISSQYRTDGSALPETVAELRNVQHWEDYMRRQQSLDAVKRMAWSHHN